MTTALYQRDRRRAARTAGLCAYCCVRAATEGYVSCPLCRESVRAAVARYRAREARRSQGPAVF